MWIWWSYMEIFGLTGNGSKIIFPDTHPVPYLKPRSETGTEIIEVIHCT
jgi:hypothetical protein